MSGQGLLDSIVGMRRCPICGMVLDRYSSDDIVDPCYRIISACGNCRFESIVSIPKSYVGKELSLALERAGVI